MSATFTAWHTESPAPDRTALYLTAINVQEIGLGGRDFIGRVLDGLEWEGPRPDRWSVGDPFAVDFLSSDRTGDWRDSWLLTWRIELRARARTPLLDGLRDLTVWDESWVGDEADPTAFEVIAVAGKSAQQPPRPLAEEVRWQCSSGHLHARIPVVRNRLDAAAATADEIRDQLNERGWLTDWLGSRDV